MSYPLVSISTTFSWSVPQSSRSEHHFLSVPRTFTDSVCCFILGRWTNLFSVCSCWTPDPCCVHLCSPRPLRCSLVWHGFPSDRSEQLVCMTQRTPPPPSLPLLPPPSPILCPPRARLCGCMRESASGQRGDICVFLWLSRNHRDVISPLLLSSSNPKLPKQNFWEPQRLIKN